MLHRKNTIASLDNNNFFENNNITIQELPFISKINLRIDPNNKDYMSICGRILKVILPLKPNTYSKNEDTKVLWLGPDEWLIINENENNIFFELNDKLNKIENSVTDVSENRTTIRLKGKKIFVLLSKFLTLDLDKNIPEEPCCAQTLFVKVPCTLINNSKNDEIPQIDILINRSHANYVYNLLIDGIDNLDI